MNDQTIDTAPRAAAPAESEVAQLVSEITKRLTYSLGKDPSVAQNHDWLTASILALRDRIIDVWRRSTKESYAHGRKRVYYLSLEFLIGRSFADALSNLQMTETMRQALAQLGVDLDAIEPIE